METRKHIALEKLQCGSHHCTQDLASMPTSLDLTKKHQKHNIL